MKIHHVVENKIKGVDGKACWPGKRYAGRKKKPDGTYKDICVPVDESTKPGQLDEISANPDYLRAAERSRSQAQATQRTFGKSPEEKAAARRTEINRDKGIAGYTKRHKAAHPEMYPKIEPRPAPQLRDPSTEYSDDYSVWAKGRRDTMEQDVAEAFIAPALSAANANAEFERTKTFVPRGYKGRVDTEVSGKEEYRSVMSALKKLARAEGQHIEAGLSDTKMSVFSKTMDSEALSDFVDMALQDFDQGVAEGWGDYSSSNTQADQQAMSAAMPTIPQFASFYNKRNKLMGTSDHNGFHFTDEYMQHWKSQGYSKGQIDKMASTASVAQNLKSGNWTAKQGVAEGSEQDLQSQMWELGKKYNSMPNGPEKEAVKQQYFAIKKQIDQQKGTWGVTAQTAPASWTQQGVAEGDISQLEKDIADAPVKPIASMESATDSDGYSVDQEDAGEYDYEGDQAKDQLQTIVAAARKLDGILDDNENMPEWVQMKITKATDYLDTAADYVAANKAQAEPMAEGEPEKIGGRYNPDDFDAMVGRLKKLAGAGPMKTVYDPQKRVYKNVPTAVQPKGKK